MVVLLLGLGDAISAGDQTDVIAWYGAVKIRDCL